MCLHNSVGFHICRPEFDIYLVLFKDSVQGKHSICIHLLYCIILSCIVMFNMYVLDMCKRIIVNVMSE